MCLLKEFGAENKGKPCVFWFYCEKYGVIIANHQRKHIKIIKTPKNRQKSAQEPLPATQAAPRALQTRKSSQNVTKRAPFEGPRSTPNRQKRVPKNNEFSDAFPEAIFLDLGLQNASKNYLKSSKIVSGSEKRDFVKILLFLMRQHDFQGPDSPKINQNRQQVAPKTNLFRD